MIARVATNPFGLKEKGNAVKEQGVLLEEDEHLKEAFVRHNLKTGDKVEQEREAIRVRDKDIEVDRRILRRVRRALKSTQNKSCAGPDHISWRLLKMIATTGLGRQLEDIRNWLRVPSQQRRLTMVTIPKPGKDHTKVKGRHPIVLANTMGKWCDKIVSQDLGGKEELRHPLSFAGRKGEGAMDSVMLMDQRRKETGGTVYGKDIKSAFNLVERAEVAGVL